MTTPKPKTPAPHRALAIGAHPDDIEFLMAGTLVLLQQAGYEIHTLNIANGSCGSATHTREQIIRLRAAESRAAAQSIGAIHHPPFVDDLQIFYEPQILARMGALLRDVAPHILLLHSPSDYMEDHQNAARLGVTAAFGRAMPNFATDPPRPPISQEVTLYHAQPHGNRDPLGGLVRPTMYVDISRVLPHKRAMLAHHRSQKEWLDRTQGMDSYLQAMEDMSREVGAMSGRFELAEGWRRRLHWGFCAPSADPLAGALRPFVHLPDPPAD